MTNSTPQEVSYCDIETHEEYLDTAELYREIVSDPKEVSDCLNCSLEIVKNSVERP